MKDSVSPPAPEHSTPVMVPTARNVDHVGLVVPNLDRALNFFTEVLGAEKLWESTFSDPDPVGTKMLDYLGAEPRASSRLAMLRLGPNFNFELLEFSAPGQRRDGLRPQDVGTAHLGLFVDDLQAAGQYLSAHGAHALAGPRVNGPDAPNAQQQSWFFFTDVGVMLELVWRPGAGTMPYEGQTKARLYGPDPFWTHE